MSVSISICIPTYNRTQGLLRLLQSIEMQTHKAFEIIVTDDSTTNDVANLIADWQLKLPITYFKNESSLGSPANWNKAISLAKYDWIKLMHDDDWFSNDTALAEFANAISTSDFVFCGNDNIYFNENRHVIETLSKDDEATLNKDYLLLFYRNVIGHPSNTLHKKTNLQYDTAFKWVVDIDFYMQYLKQSKRFYYIPKVLVNTGIDNTTVSHSSYKNPAVEIPEYLQMLEKMGTHLLLSNQYVFAAIWTLVKKFKVKRIEEMIPKYYDGIVPNGLQQIIDAQKNIPRILLKQTPVSNYLMIGCFKKNKI